MPVYSQTINLSIDHYMSSNRALNAKENLKKLIQLAYRLHATIELHRLFFFEGILPKGPYLPCVSMAGRALLAGYHLVIIPHIENKYIVTATQLQSINKTSLTAYIVIHKFITLLVRTTTWRMGVWSLPWRWRILYTLLETSRRINAKTCQFLRLL